MLEALRRAVRIVRLWVESVQPRWLWWYLPLVAFEVGMVIGVIIVLAGR